MRRADHIIDLGPRTGNFLEPAALRPPGSARGRAGSSIDHAQPITVEHSPLAKWLTTLSPNFFKICLFSNLLMRHSAI